MRVALVYNSRAGTATSEAVVVSALGAIGWTAVCRISESGVDTALSHRADVVVAAGGDGTVARVAKRLARIDMPMAILPMGTVNNVARSLGIGVDALAAAAGLARAKECRIDLGALRTDSEDDYFIEGFSMGFFADFLGETANREHKKEGKALTVIADELEKYAPHHYEVRADGRDLSGDYLLVAVMNMRSLGPSLTLAPHAMCADGDLDIVRIRPESKSAIVTALRQAVSEQALVLPTFDAVRAKHIRLRTAARWAHLDDRPRELEGAIDIRVEPNAVRMLVPAA